METRPELDFLLAHKCDEAQGYYFSKAVPARQFARLLMVAAQRTPAAQAAVISELKHERRREPEPAATSAEAGSLLVTK